MEEKLAMKHVEKYPLGSIRAPFIQLRSEIVPSEAAAEAGSGLRNGGSHNSIFARKSTPLDGRS